MIGLCCNKTNDAITNHDKGDDYRDDNRDNVGDNYGNKDKNNDSNAPSISGSDGPIFDLIATPRSCLSLADEDRATKTITMQPWCTMYLRIVIYLPYKYPIKTIVKMCHNLLYAKIGVLELCC